MLIDMTSSGFDERNDSIHVFADHRSDSYAHNQVQTRAELIPTPAAAIGGAAKRHHVFPDAYVHMQQGKYVVLRVRHIEGRRPACSHGPLPASPGNQLAA
ncbi:hypothetical protein [Mycobacterium xenopi]|uniref:hypothetical protein n=1 Tax=Mycobacterium xenopi TaxID=1789 RepID=UPI0022EA9984|nr:hypothetical protein [Mycobacterium xenopi]MDA3656880.1 hypothetical protein [Mycobacterium xenopi]